MADYPHPASPGRSANMRANRRSDTKPELALRRELHRQGYRYRKDYRLDLEGARVRPDIAFTARHVAVFVDGCFWHCCPEHGTQPAANTWYWEPKLARNVERDRAADAALTAAGWCVVRVWEHESLEGAVAAVTGALAASGLVRPVAASTGSAASTAATARAAAAAAAPETETEAGIPPAELSSAERVVIETAAVETAAVEPANVEPANVEPAAVETAAVETAAVEPATVEPANVEPANVEPANVEPPNRLTRRQPA